MLSGRNRAERLCFDGILNFKINLDTVSFSNIANFNNNLLTLILVNFSIIWA